MINKALFNLKKTLSKGNVHGCSKCAIVELHGINGAHHQIVPIKSPCKMDFPLGTCQKPWTQLKSK